MTGIQQNFTSKADALNSLAEAFGADKARNLGLEKMYDASTGTYYCHGKRYSRTLIAEAKGYLYGEAQKYSSKGAEWRDLALVYDLAYEAVDSLTDANVEKLKAEKAKKGDQGA